MTRAKSDVDARGPREEGGGKPDTANRAPTEGGSHAGVEAEADRTEREQRELRGDPWRDDGRSGPRRGSTKGGPTGGQSEGSGKNRASGH